MESESEGATPSLRNRQRVPANDEEILKFQTESDRNVSSLFPTKKNKAAHQKTEVENENLLHPHDMFYGFLQLKAKKGYFYTKDGTFVTQNDKESKEVYVVEKKKDVWDYDNAVKLNLNHDNFLKFAGVIHVESSGEKKESFALGTAIINASLNGGQSVTYLISNSNFTRAILNSKYDSFLKAPVNDRFAISATVNALLFQLGDNRGSDYSNGGVMWEGGELAAKGASQHKPTFYGTSISGDNWKSFSDYWTQHSKELKSDYGKDKVADISSNYDKEAKAYNLKATSKRQKDKMLLKSTAVYGGTIFFGPNKTKKNESGQWKYLSIYSK